MELHVMVEVQRLFATPCAISWWVLSMANAPLPQQYLMGSAI